MHTQSITRLSRKVAVQRHEPTQVGILETAQQPMSGRGHTAYSQAPRLLPSSEPAGLPRVACSVRTLPLASPSAETLRVFTLRVVGLREVLGVQERATCSNLQFGGLGRVRRRVPGFPLW